MTTRREWRRQRAYSNEWDLLEDENEGFGSSENRRNLPERKSVGGVAGLRRGRQNKPGDKNKYSTYQALIIFYYLPFGSKYFLNSFCVGSSMTRWLD